MAQPSSSRSSRRFASWIAAGAVAALAAGAVALHHRRDADACGWSGPEIEELTTFDQQVTGGGRGSALFYDPFTGGFGERCDGCLRRDLVADWRRYLGDAVSTADWEAVLFEATADDLTAIAARLTDPDRQVPARFANSSMWRARAAARRRLRGAVAAVQLARDVERISTLESPRVPAAGRDRPLARARAAMASAPDRFLRQRAAFQVLRVLFYQRAWPAAVEFFDRNAAVLAAPSRTLGYRARYYAAGALARSGKRARANLELARISAGYPALAGPATRDFAPMDDRDWRASLALARSVRDKTELWRAAGLRLDGIVAIKEIVALDPKSNLLALLAVRELVRADANENAAERRAGFDGLEPLVVRIARTPGADRPWLMELVAGHIAAARGDLAAARERLGRATAARPRDRRVTAQARASLALALARSWKIEPAREQELVDTLAAIPAEFPHRGPLVLAVRRDLAVAYAAARRPVDAEFLDPGRRDWVGPARDDVAFLKQMIARTHKSSTAFDRFVLDSVYTRPGLELTLARRHLRDDDLTAAARVLAASEAGKSPLHTDPFAMRIVDCHDCDHQQFASSPWTFARFVARLIELRRAAQGKGEPAAAASLALGKALYNVTWYGNARIVLEPTFEQPGDTAAAEKWYARAFKLSRKPELRAEAAYLAAKAELGTQLTRVSTGNRSAFWDPPPLPVPATWFPRLRSLARTRYHAEVLAECGHYRRWLETAR